MYGLLRSCFLGLLGSTILVPCASAEVRIKCPSGEVRIQLNIRDVAIRYEAPTSVAIGKMGPFSYELSLSPAQLQQIATETQRANEFVKALIVAYNSCAISKEDFRTGLFQMYSGFEESAAECSQIVSKLSQNQTMARVDRRLLDRVFTTLQKIADLDANNTERILLAIEREPDQGFSLREIGGSLSNSSLGEFLHTNAIFDPSMASAYSSSAQISGFTQNPNTTWTAGALPGLVTNVPDLSMVVVGSFGSSTDNALIRTTGLNPSLPSTWAAADQPAFVTNLPKLSTLVVGGSVSLTDSTLIRAAGLNPILPPTWAPADQPGFVTNFPNTSNITGGGNVWELKSATTSWTETKTLDQNISVLSAALLRSTITPIPAEYEFPSISSVCGGQGQVVLCKTTVTSGVGSSSMPQFANPSLLDVTISGRQLNTSTVSPISGSEQVH